MTPKQSLDQHIQSVRAGELIRAVVGHYGQVEFAAWLKYLGFDADHKRLTAKPGSCAICDHPGQLVIFNGQFVCVQCGVGLAFAHAPMPPSSQARNNPAKAEPERRPVSTTLQDAAGQGHKQEALA